MSDTDALTSYDGSGRLGPEIRVLPVMQISTAYLEAKRTVRCYLLVRYLEHKLSPEYCDICGDQAPNMPQDNSNERAGPPES